MTTSFPVPPSDDGRSHVYLSVGHQQMMTDAMRPLGLSVWQMIALRRMETAGSRLWVDVTDTLATPGARDAFVAMVGRSDPLSADALREVVARNPTEPASPAAPTAPAAGGAGPLGLPPEPLPTDPAIVDALIVATDASVEVAEASVAAVSGVAVFDAVAADIETMRLLLGDQRSMQAIMAGMEATWWLTDRMAEWLGERNAADVLIRSAPGNVTSQMGLALLDVADVVRRRPAVVAALRRAVGEGWPEGALDALQGLDGGEEVREALAGYLQRYGMRCIGEIDITRSRWAEQPAALVRVVLAHCDQFPPGEAARRFEQGRREAEQKEHDLLRRLHSLPDGAAKAVETEAMIRRVRTFVGFREYPKYGIVRRLAIYKRALMAEADRLVASGAIGGRDDVFFLTFDEFREAVGSGSVDRALIAGRRAAFEADLGLIPPRVLVSDGVAVAGSYRRDDAPSGALVGLGVSTGVVEGRARIVTDLLDADLEAGDILVTAHTDPSWTPLFVSIAGLVTEVGGLMTHGAVVAREYGLPAVVGVEHATTRIPDGARIRLDATHGVVEVVACGGVPDCEMGGDAPCWAHLFEEDLDA